MHAKPVTLTRGLLPFGQLLKLVQTMKIMGPDHASSCHLQVGGMALFSGNVAEMQTGEGKTLVATLAAYLHALEGRGVHIVTVNEYLANRDANW